ncbi:ThiF family adenylyltransferase, partial [Acinetobacter baumannii]
VFNYVETASDRVGIGVLTERLVNERVAIIGVGGTGGYILDFVAKTPVREIRLFDSDEFLTPNAFRAPGAPSLEELREAPKKVEYL